MRASVNGIEIDYDLTGPEKAPVVMLSHSLACARAMWEPQLPALTKDYRVLNYDMRGHGRTSVPAPPYSFAALTADVVGLLDHLRIDKVAFVGLSIGGMIGQHLAIQHANRLRCAVLCCTTSAIPVTVRPVWDERIAAVEASGMAAVLSGTLERWFTAPYRAAHPDVIEWISGMIRNTPVKGFVGCGRAIQGLDITAELPKIKLPVLILAGEKDPGIPPAMSEVIRAGIAGSEYTVVKDAAHIANVEQAEAFTKAVTAFLARHRA
ncbi:MAG TPA: 3-oxoadipate enol-lactonase [Candidatus Acidoferrum sp.]|nr:3-oxoadipate enol-lactonase [Candidatus Acidoferrum sp.]